MATLDVVDSSNGKAGTVELAPSVFEAEVKPHLFHAEVRRQLALRRAGTHSSKNRTAVSGGGAKPYRQKGTGRARQGTIRAVQWAGGGVAFGPVPRKYEHKVPKKVRAGALRSALSQRQAEEAITVVDGLEIAEYRTSKVVGILSSLGLADDSVLVVTDAANEHLEGSARNLPRVAVVRAEGVNVYDVLRHDKLLLTKAAAEALGARLAPRKKSEASS